MGGTATLINLDYKLIVIGKYEEVNSQQAAKFQGSWEDWTLMEYMDTSFCNRISLIL